MESILENVEEVLNELKNRYKEIEKINIEIRAKQRKIKKMKDEVNLYTIGDFRRKMKEEFIKTLEENVEESIENSKELTKKLGEDFLEKKKQLKDMVNERLSLFKTKNALEEINSSENDDSQISGISDYIIVEDNMQEYENIRYLQVQIDGLFIETIDKVEKFIKGLKKEDNEKEQNTKSENAEEIKDEDSDIDVISCDDDAR